MAKISAFRSKYIVPSVFLYNMGAFHKAYICS